MWYYYLLQQRKKPRQGAAVPDAFSKLFKSDLGKAMRATYNAQIKEYDKMKSFNLGYSLSGLPPHLRNL